MLKLSHLIKLCLTYCVFILSLPQTDAQEAKVEIGENVQIVKAENNLTWLEPSLATHPENPDFLMVASFSSDITDRSKITKTLGVFKSVDGGKSWAKKEIDCLSCSDPWISITNEGTVFLSVLGTHPKVPNDGNYQLLLYTSIDSGESWSTIPQSFEGGHDGPRTSVGPDGSVYLISSTYALDEDKKSRSALFIGKTEPKQTTIKLVQHYIPSNLNLNFDMSAVLNDGTLYLTYLDLMRKVDGGFRSRKGRLSSPRAWAIKSNDQGKTFSAPKFISEEAAFRPSSFTLSPSDKYKDRMFYASMTKTLRDIMFTYSSDGGDEWVQVKVEPSADKDRSRWFPQMAMNNAGVLALAWLDKRDDPSGACYAPYLSISKDGGDTFSKPFRVASEISCVDKSKLSPAGRWDVGADYFGLIATKDNKFHIVWPDARNGAFEIWYSKITVSN